MSQVMTKSQPLVAIIQGANTIPKRLPHHQLHPEAPITLKSLTRLPVLLASPNIPTTRR